MQASQFMQSNFIFENSTNSKELLLEDLLHNTHGLLKTLLDETFVRLV